MHGFAVVVCAAQRREARVEHVVTGGIDQHARFASGAAGPAGSAAFGCLGQRSLDQFASRLRDALLFGLVGGLVEVLAAVDPHFLRSRIGGQRVVAPQHQVGVLA